MFYSHTILAKKGPLGTVWCAAHLQHKLRKPQYLSTDILKTADKIMSPPMPIALRMSGHLLLGIVRIYSKQVDYFQEDCNVILITLNKVYAAATLNLPEDASQAPYSSVTLPKNFELDALEVEYNFNEFDDSHTKNPEDITLTEQIPTGRDPYIAITLDENDLRSSSFTQDNSEVGPTPMDEDIPSSPVQLHNAASGIDNQSPPTNRFGADENETVRHDSTPQRIPSIEIMRDARNGFHFNTSPVLPDRIEPDKFLDEQMNLDNDVRTPVINEEVVLSAVRSPSQERHPEENSFGHNSSSHFDHSMADLEIQPTPPRVEPTPQQVEVPKIRRHKRLLYDEQTVFSNADMKKFLDNTTDLRRVKKSRNGPFKLDIWKTSKRAKKDDVFFEPLITGACLELQDIYNENFISSKPHLVITTDNENQGVTNAEPQHNDEENQNANNAEPQHNDEENQDANNAEPHNEPEIEIFRDRNASPDRPDFGTFVPSDPSIGRNFSTPVNNNESAMQSGHLETIDWDASERTTEIRGSSRHIDSDMGTTPDRVSRDGFNFENSALFDIPEELTSPGDLGFLEQDDNSPTAFEGTPGSDFGTTNQQTSALHGLTSRTRSVAEYFRNQSPVAPILGNSGGPLKGDLSLNKILNGKTRKICARMFYETLVLKSCDFINVQQEQPYGDVTLKVTPKLSKGDFSG